MLNKKNTFQVGDNVWVYLNRSKLHNGCYNTWITGKVLGFTNKRIKCETDQPTNRTGKLIANYLPKNVKQITREAI